MTVPNKKMAIFSRRTIQTFLNSNRKCFDDESVESHVKRLNREDTTSLHAEWEVAIIYCLSKVGLVEHEINLGGSSNLDLFFKSDDIEFVADISTVSDKYQEKNNNYDAFVSAVRDAAVKIGLDSIGGIHFDVKGKDIGKYPKKKVSLRLPKRNEYHHFIDTHIKQFLINIRTSPDQKHCTSTSEGEISINLSYDPSKKRYVSGNYPSCTAVYAIQNNPLYNRLKRKATQIKKSGYVGIKGIVLCDGSCDVFRTEYSCPNHSARDIVEHFIQKNTSIDFILLIHVKEDKKSSELRYTRKVVSSPYFNQSVNDEIKHALYNAFNVGISHLPSPIRTAQNAINVLEQKGKGSLPWDTFYGGCTMGSNSVEFSLRTLLDLLAGNLSSDEFTSNHKELAKLFQQKLLLGQLPNSIEVEHKADLDDDWVRFSFKSKKDPAISSFV